MYVDIARYVDMALAGRKEAREGGQRLGFEDFCNCFLLQLLDRIASIFDYLYSIHKQMTKFEKKAFSLNPDRHSI